MSFTFILYIYLIKDSTANSSQAHILFPMTQVSTGSSALGRRARSGVALRFFLFPSPGQGPFQGWAPGKGGREAAEMCLLNRGTP